MEDTFNDPTSLNYIKVTDLITLHVEGHLLEDTCFQIRFLRTHLGGHILEDTSWRTHVGGHMLEDTCWRTLVCKLEDTCL